MQANTVWEEIPGRAKQYKEKLKYYPNKLAVGVATKIYINRLERKDRK